MTSTTTDEQSSQKNITWHTYSTEEVCRYWSSNSQNGLSEEEAQKRSHDWGPNQLPEPEPDTLLQIFLRQFKSPLIYLLLVAAVIVLLLGEYVDGGIILFVLIFNAVIGTIQAYKAQNTLEALKRFAETEATVIREGKSRVLPDKQIVPGDIIQLQEGEKVPADARIISAHNLAINESALTGESEAVHKYSDTLSEDKLPLGDRRNMIYKGSNVVSGKATAVVVATGLRTYIGQISNEIEEMQTEIPLQKDVRHLSHAIIVVVLILAVFIFTAGIWITGEEIAEMFPLAVAVVVSAIPEALPVVMTLLLATGVWRMSKRNVLIKQLQAVEGLGEARVIAVDKTGTITCNQLVVRELHSHGNAYAISGAGFDPHGRISSQTEDKEIEGDSDPYLFHFALISALASNAQLYPVSGSEQFKVTGDPTEAALMVLAVKAANLDKKQLLEKYPLVDELPFDSSNKYHALLHYNEQGGKWLIVVGAPEVLLDKCSRIWKGDEQQELTEEYRREIEKTVEELSGRGLRVLAMAEKGSSADKLSSEEINGLDLVGLTAMRDGLRTGVDQAVKTAHQAGVKVVMITGDHRITAQAIAQKAGIYKSGDTVIEGYEIDKLTDEQLAEKVEDCTVFARVSPEHKYRIVSAFQARDEIIAMTGDGVNDALSLVAADLGMSMGRQGTEVAKEASDMVIMDDDFSSIIAAIEEGRNIYQGIKKVVLFLFATSLGEIIIITGSILLGLPLPITAAQIIWINFVTDGFLVTALAMDPKEEGLLRGSFKRPSRWIVDKPLLQRMVIMSTVMAVGSLVLFMNFKPQLEEYYPTAVTVTVSAIAAFQWFNIWNCRSDRKSVFQMNPLSNLYLLGAFLLVIALHVTAIYTPLLQDILDLVPLGITEWLIIISTALTVILADELWKLLRRKVDEQPAPTVQQTFK